MNRQIISFLIAAAAGIPAVAAPVSLRCEHLEAPLGVNTTAPRFSWKNNPLEVKSQTAYEIMAGTDSLSLARNGVADLWQSGKVVSPASVLVEYAGKKLPARTQGWWKVRVWNEKGKRGQWSAPSRFGVGIVADADVPMRGHYIAMPQDGGADVNAPILRKQFGFSRREGKVMAHVNSLGYHELYVNGKKAGENMLSPGVSQLGRRSLIVTYDITPLMVDGENDIVLWLGQGWYKPNTYKAEYPGPVARMEIDLVNGTAHEPLLVTDGTWSAAESGRHDIGTWYPLQFGGEMVDGAHTPVDMTPYSLAGLSWQKVATPAITSHLATPEASEQNRITVTTAPVKTGRFPDGTIMIDMGRVFTGWFEMEMPQLPAGTEVTMEYSDNLLPDGNMDPQGESDVYVAAGRAGERFCNKFNHHAYRYVRLRGVNDVPSAQSCRGHQIHGDYAGASTFRCSDADLNAVHDMINYTMKCLTFSGYMVDCPHLERTGYGGDGNSSTMTLQTMYDVAPTYANWLQAWGDVMTPDGSLPHVAPAGGGGGGPYWCGFIVQAPWRTWLNYGDRRMLETYYPMMKQWMGYVDANTRDGLLRRWPDTENRMWYLGDWLAPDGVDAGNPASVDLVNNCFVSDCLDKMERIANELSLPEEAAVWRKKRLALNAAIHYNFYDSDKRQYATGSQLDMTYPMLVGAVPAELHKAVSDRMLELSATKWRGHIGAGLVGVPIVTQWAIDERQPDFMATMLRQRDYPGYLYMIDNGATATWEYWNGERSRVHNCYNGVGLWFYQALGGLVPDTPGYGRFTVNPQPAAGVDWAEVTKETPYGTAAVKWVRLGDGSLEYAVTVPPGSTARVAVPTGMATATKGYCPSADGYIALSPGMHTVRFR